MEGTVSHGFGVRRLAVLAASAAALLAVALPGTAFARFLDVLHNPTGAPITVSLDLGGGRNDNGNLGSDSGTTVNDSSSGDGNTTTGDVSAMTTADNWATTWDTITDTDGNPSGDPTLAHNWQTNLSSSRVDRADVVGTNGGSSDELVWQYDNLTVQPGQTLIYMTTEAMRADNVQTHNVAGALGQEPPELFAGMSLTELGQLQNWDGTDVDKDSVANNSDNCAFVANGDQADLDRDGQGDACDDDIDGDGLSNSVEEQVGLNPRNPDTDGDGVNDKNDACGKTAGRGPDGCPVVTASTADNKPPALGVK